MRVVMGRDPVTKVPSLCGFCHVRGLCHIRRAADNSLRFKIGAHSGADIPALLPPLKACWDGSLCLHLSHHKRSQYVAAAKHKDMQLIDEHFWKGWDKPILLTRWVKFADATWSGSD